MKTRRLLTATIQINLVILLAALNAKAQGYSNRVLDLENEKSSLRSKNSFGIFVGIGGVNALHVGTKYYYSNDKSIELAAGRSVLTELVGEVASFFACGHNWYLKPYRVVTPHISSVISFGTIRSTQGAPLGNLYLASTTMGLDASWNAGFNLYGKLGLMLGKLSPGQTTIVVDFGLGIGWIF